MDMTGEMELRHLPTQQQLQLAKLLDMDDSILSLVMGNIAKDINNLNSELRFNSAHIDSVREHAERHRKSPILILLDEWSTMGKERPRMKHLLSLLVKCQLFYAADYVADLIRVEKPERPKTGPAALVDISLTEDESVENIVRNIEYPFSSIDINVNKNQFTKASPDIPKNIIITSNSEQKTQSTARAQSDIFQQQIEQTDLIKFSRSIEIPVTVNSSESTLDNIPALSVIHQTTSNELQTNSENIPAFLLSSSDNKSANNEIPDFSGLLNAQSTQQSTFDSTDESESFTSSIKSE